MKNLIPSKSKRTELASRAGQIWPFGDFAFGLSRMRDEFDQFFDRLSDRFTSIAGFNEKGWQWGLDVEEEEDKVVVRAEAPGFDADDFDVRVEDSRLVLKASKKVETKDDKGKVKEYREQECYESITLPAGVDKKKVDAKYHNGVLTVTMPKTETAKAQRIAVKSD